MIPRYTRPEMGKLWAPENKFSMWLKVELAILEARALLGKITQEQYDKIRAHASFDLVRIEQLDEELGHDLNAFIQAVREKLRAAGVPSADADKVHECHTSYDTEDPAFMLLLIEAAHYILDALRELSETLGCKAKEYKSALMIARSHGQFAEPSSFSHLLLGWVDEIERAHSDIYHVVETELRVGKMSGTVGNYAGLDPEEERIACEILGLKPAKIATQILSRTRHARFMSALTTASGAIEQMFSTLWVMMHSCVKEVEEPRGKNKRDSSSMAWKKNPNGSEQMFGLPRVMRGYSVAAQEDCRVLESRDISQSSVERIIFPDATTLLHYMAFRAKKLIAGLVILPGLEGNVQRTQGVWAGQRIRYALTNAGVDDTVAYLHIQKTSFAAVQDNRHLRELFRTEPLSETDTRTVAEVLGEDQLETSFDVMSYVGEGLRAIYDRFPCMST